MVTGQVVPNAKRNLARIFAADLILRWAYQMGKTPLLPLFAAALGAAEMMTGLVVAVSTFTGMILKPVFGILSDRNGRRIWLLLALILFIILPFLYRFVETPEQLFALRLIHGLATAIFGPVSLSYVADIGHQNRASRLAVFGMARSTATLLAPLSAGYVLTYYPIETVFTAIGFLSLVAALPLLMLSEPASVKPTTKTSLISHFGAAIKLSVATPAIWLAGLLELMVYLVTYAVRAFLP
ncbi:MAG: MFS family permease, partial [Paracoccaceae bacterium]